MRTIKRDFLFFAKSDVEREIWVESFSKVIESNERGMTNFNLKSSSAIYMKQMNSSTPLVQSIHRDNILKREKRAKIEGIESYHSEYLEVTKFAIKGEFQKAIENLGLFHKSEYHRKYFMLEFGQPYCYYYKSKKDSAHQKSYFQSDIISCAIMDESEVSEKLQERERKRSKSFLRGKNQELKRCSWNFPFKLAFKDREYELYAPTRADRE